MKFYITLHTFPSTYIIYLKLQVYGVDWDGPLSSEENLVQVPDTRFPISHSDFLLLNEEINPLDDTTIHGIGLYERTLEFVTSRITS